jgi:hypothetical protein
MVFVKGFLGALHSPLARLLSSFTAPFWSIMSFFVPFFASTVEHSTSNDLSFGRLPPLSPLCGITSTAIITSGVRPKRFHSHNDSCVRGVSCVENIQLNRNRIPGSRKTPLYHALSLGAGSGMNFFYSVLVYMGLTLVFVQWNPTFAS